MMETELIDKTFIFLSKMEDHYIFPSSLPNKLNLQNTNPIMLLETIYKIGFAEKEKNQQQSLGASQPIYNYWINSDGRQFIENLPAEFSQKPYTFFLQQKESDKTLSLEKLNLEITDLRNKVLDYDERKRMTKYSLVISFLALLVSLLALLYNKSD